MRQSHFFRPRTIVGVVMLMLPGYAWSAAPATATDCQPPAANILQEVTLEVRDRERAETPLVLPAGIDLLLVARETGIDSMLELRATRGPRIAAADNPLRRLGPQRMLLGRAAAARRVFVGAVGKEPGRGRLVVTLLSLAGTPQQCVTALRAIGEADRHYARAQALALGEQAVSPDEGDTENRAAAENYRCAVQALESHPGALRAHAQLSLAGALLLGAQDWPEAELAAIRAQSEYQSIRGDYGSDRARLFWAMAHMEHALKDVGDSMTADEAKQRTSKMLREAREALLTLAEMHRARGEPYDQAVALNNLAQAFHDEEKFKDELKFYKDALDLQRSLGERNPQAQISNNMALAHLEMGNFSLARVAFAQALDLIDEKVSPKLYADVLNNYALTDLRTGHPDDALRRYNQALKILVRLNSKREQARSLNGMASTYRLIGDSSEVLPLYQRALSLRSRDADPIGYLKSIRSLADALNDAGRFEEAIVKRRQALRVASTPVTRAQIRVEMIGDQFGAGKLDDARQTVVEVLSDPEVADPIVRAGALLGRARIGRARGERVAAAADAAAATDIFHQYDLGKDEFAALLLGARISCDSHDFAVATKGADRALATAETLRRSSNNPALRASLWQPLRPAFDFKMRLLMGGTVCGPAPPSEREVSADERARRSLELSELSRSRSLADFRRIAARRARSTQRSDDDLRLDELFERIAALKAGIENQAENGRQDSEDSKDLRADLEARMRDLDILGAAGVANYAPPEESRRELARSIETIPPDAAVVEYWLGAEQAFAWVVTRSHVQLIALGPSENINKAAIRLSESMTKLHSTAPEQRLADARALHALIVAPLPQGALRAHLIYFVPDGALHRVAFATLVSSKAGAEARFLIDDHDVAVAASVGSFGAGPAPAKLDAHSPLLIVSDPVYARDDDRFSADRREVLAAEPPGIARRGGPTFRRLPGSAKEARAVEALFAAESVEKLSGFGATRDALLSRDLSRYRIVHFAMHAVVDSAAPQLSMLLFSTLDPAGKSIPGQVFAGDLLSRNLESTELIVLSGCETSLGKETAGEGLLGLRYAAHAAGARSVVASMWPVADLVGPPLMKKLYSGVTGEGDSPVAALSKSMRETRKRWSDPALWGVFQVSSVDRAGTLH